VSHKLTLAENGSTIHEYPPPDKDLPVMILPLCKGRKLHYKTSLGIPGDGLSLTQSSSWVTLAFE